MARPKFAVPTIKAIKEYFNLKGSEVMKFKNALTDSEWKQFKKDFDRARVTYPGDFGELAEVKE